MRATVWTRWDVSKQGHNGESKCIFDGDIEHVPREGDYVCVREGFAGCKVTTVMFDFVRGDVEIQTSTVDSENEYGPCLRRSPT